LPTRLGLCRKTSGCDRSPYNDDHLNKALKPSSFVHICSTHLKPTLDSLVHLASNSEAKKRFTLLAITHETVAKLGSQHFSLSRATISEQGCKGFSPAVKGTVGDEFRPLVHCDRFKKSQTVWSAHCLLEILSLRPLQEL